MSKPGLIARIALLVIGIEVAAFGTLGWFYVDRYSSKADENLRARLRVVGEMIAGEELPISAIARQGVIDSMLGAPYIRGMVVGGNGRVIVATDPAQLGRQMAEIPGLPADWLAAGGPAERIIADADVLTSVMRIGNPANGAPQYTVIVTVGTAGLASQKRAIVFWGLFASTLFILLTSAGIVLVAQRFIARRVGASLAVLSALEGGELDTRIEVTSSDELGQLQRGINSMAGKVGELLAQQRRNAEEMREQKDLLQSVLEHAPIRVFWKDRESRFLGCNGRFARDAGLAAPEDLFGKTDFDLCWSEQAALYRADDRAVMESGQPQLEIEEPQTAPDRHTVWLSTSKVPLRDAAGEVIGVLGIYSDITARKQAEADLRLYANVFSHSHEAALISDSANRIVAVNPAFIRLTGYAAADVLGQNPRLLASGQTPQETYQEMWEALRRTDYWQGELVDRRKDGSTYQKWISISVIRDATGCITHYIALFTDITERKNAEQRIQYMAHHDELTGLVNRHSLQDRLGQALVTAQRIHMPMAVMFIDMDRFKVINDTLGHQVGDNLLIEVAKRLRASVRESDIVARIGGDEFVVVLTGMEAAFDAMPVSIKILDALAQPYAIDGNLLYSTPSIGISVYPGDGDSVESLMKNADTAMYHAKAQGRNNIQFFTAAMNAAAAERMELERDLRQAIGAGQLELHYQPQVCTASGLACGVEALVRWNHPQRGMISPLQFIPIAEESGLIEPLGAWVLEEACRQIDVWRAAGIGGLRMAVNLSAHQLRSATLVADVAAAMHRHGIRPDELELEVTESVAMSDPERAIKTLQALRNLGIQLAIDDFGTGYSSLAYLKQLPVHCLKIDRSFVKDIETNENDAAISASILALAHSIGLKVVAEGVESAAQRDFLAAHDCDYLQGYYFARPEPAARCTATLQAIGVKPGPETKA